MQQDMGHIHKNGYKAKCGHYHRAFIYVCNTDSVHSGDLKDVNDGFQAPSPDLFSLCVHSCILV